MVHGGGGKVRESEMIDIVMTEKDFLCSCGNPMKLHFDKIVQYETIRYFGDKGYPLEIPMYGNWMIYFSCNPGGCMEISIFHQMDGLPECRPGLIYFDSITKNTDGSITAEWECRLCEEKIKVTFPDEFLYGAEFGMVRR